MYVLSFGIDPGFISAAILRDRPQAGRPPEVHCPEAHPREVRRYLEVRQGFLPEARHSAAGDDEDGHGSS